MTKPKFARPINIILLASGLTGLFLALLLLLFEYVGLMSISFVGLIVVFFSTVFLSLSFFGFLIGRFVNRRLRLMYSVITSRQEGKDLKYNLRDDVMTKLTKDTAEWAAVQKEQITVLKKQAAFRKEFLGNLAHELKTPVFSIQGYILTLLEGGLEDERVNRDFLERASNGVDRISNLLEDLDEIARFETDRFKLKLQRFNLVDLVKSIFNELEPKAEEKKIGLEFDQNYEPIFVLADKTRITQVIVNLVSNSISYGKEEGKTIVKMHNIENKKVLIEVMDNGVGMSSEHLPRLFERFYRVDKSRERNIGGSGLGLAIVKHIIEAHKETINVRSTEGVGSMFSFTLERA